MDQILSNFIPYSNPYIIISWKVPSNFTNQLVELRSEVLWDGNISLDYPVEVSGAQPARIIADTSFTMKGWLFKGDTTDVKNIFVIDQDYIPVNTFDYE